MNTNLIINRLPETLRKIGISKTNLHLKIKANLWPAPISLGARAIGFYAHETQAMLAAMGVGKTDEEMRQLVSDLVQQRNKAV